MKNDELEDLYKTYYAELYIYALSFCKDYHLAQDLVSETFFKALLSIENSQEYIKYWLFRVCKNLYLDHLRKNKYLHHVDDLNKDKLFIEDNTLDKIVQNEERRRVYYEVLKLPQSYKEIIILYYYCTLTLQEIATITSVSEGAARVLLFRARRKLKVVLKEEEK